MWPFSNSSWQLVARAKKDQQAAAIDEGLQAAGPATAQDQVYLSSSASNIVARIQTGQWTAGAVTRAYVRRAAVVNARLNCLADVRFKAAIEEADALDAEYASSKTLRGRLHGVPISVKDNFKVGGLDNSCGFTSWTDLPAKEDEGLVKVMRSEGAIIIAKTNVPQTLMFFETTNPVFGRTSNPWLTTHTCGGSSGGEAALVAAGGSTLGLGTDIGGSVRIPAFYCGLYALKPSARRVSNEGRSETCPGQESVQVSAGPIARTLQDVDLISRIIMGRRTTPGDSLPPIPYQEVKIPPSTRLRFGFYTFDGCYRTSPANERAVHETVTALRAAGHEVIEFEPPNVTRAIELFIGLVSADGYSTIQEPIRNDPEEKELYLITLGTKLPAFLRIFAVWAASTFIGDKQLVAILGNSKQKSVPEVYKLNVARNEYTELWYTDVWDRYGFDGIIAPSQAIPAPAHGMTRMVPALAVSTFLYNLIDMPVGIIPVTRVDAKKDALSPAWLAAGPRGGPMVERQLYEVAEPIYDSKRMEGLPVGVQIVGRRWADEKVLAMMQVVDEALGQRGFPASWSP